MANVKKLLRYSGPDIGQIMASAEATTHSKIRAALLRTVPGQRDLVTSLRELATLSSDGVHTLGTVHSSLSASSFALRAPPATPAALPLPSTLLSPQALEDLQTALRRYLMVRRSRHRMVRHTRMLTAATNRMSTNFGAHHSRGIAPWLREFEVSFHSLTYVPALPGRDPSTHTYLACQAAG